ncbi:MAG: class I SAM-dependent methyltransferase [Burkholderiales bacterium]
MNEQSATHNTPYNSTDLAWEEWGKRDPYFGVITNPKFRRDNLSAEAKAEFLESGRHHIEHFFQVIRHHVDPTFEPKRAMDFGCGVGRISIPLAAKVGEVVAVDVSPSMLQEAQRNALETGIENMVCVQSDDDLSLLAGEFDFIHSSIVFQHIPPSRGRVIFRELLKRLAPGGVCAVHFLYSKAQYAEFCGLPPPPLSNEVEETLKAVELATSEPLSLRGDPPAPTTESSVCEDPPGEGAPPPGYSSEAPDPEMQMNTYHLNEIMFLIQRIGVSRMYLEFSDHGGELGAVLFFQSPSDPCGNTSSPNRRATRPGEC